MGFPATFTFEGNEGNGCTDGGQHAFISGQVSANGRIDWTLRGENHVAISNYRYFGKVFVRDSAGNVLASCDCGPIDVGGNVFGLGTGSVSGAAQVSEEVMSQAASAFATAGGQDVLWSNFDIDKAIEIGAGIVAILG